MPGREIWREGKGGEGMEEGKEGRQDDGESMGKQIKNKGLG